MAAFMMEHPNLAKSRILYWGQAKQLWEQLTNKLNSYGPPVKDSKVWRKVFSDQKHNVKKKMYFNEAASQLKTGERSYKEITSTEEQIIQASGIDIGSQKASTENEPEDMNETLPITTPVNTISPQTFTIVQQGNSWVMSSGGNINNSSNNMANNSTTSSATIAAPIVSVPQVITQQQQHRAGTLLANKSPKTQVQYY